MSEAETDEQSAPIRSVTPEYFGRPDAEMDVIGWGIFLGMLVILLPILPVLVLLWLVTKLLGSPGGE